MTGSRRGRSALLVLGVLVLVASAPLGSGAPASSPPGFDPDSVLLRVHVTPDGTAEWRVAYRLRLAGPNESAAFEGLRADVESDPARYERRFAGLLRGTVRKAENATGREMALRDTDVTVSRRAIPTETGVVAYTFTWTGFARRADGRLFVGDGLRGLPLDAETTLQVTWPDSHRAAVVRPGPDERRPGVAVWEGPTTFATDEPRLRLVPRTATPSPATTATAAGPTATTASDGPVATGRRTETGTVAGTSPDSSRNQFGAPSGSADSGLPLSGVVPVAGVAVLATVGAAGWLVRTDRDDANADGGAEAAADAGSEPETADAGPATGTDGDAAGPPSELLSPEERVRSALEANGGRMKQAELADRLDWTAPKTSRVVNDLRESDAVDVFRLGRENVVTLPEEGLRDD